MSNFSLPGFNGNPRNNPSPGTTVRELSPQTAKDLFGAAFGSAPSGQNPMTAGISDSAGAPNPYGQPAGGTYGSPSVGLPKYGGGGTSRYYDFSSPLSGANLQDYLQYLQREMSKPTSQITDIPTITPNMDADTAMSIMKGHPEVYGTVWQDGNDAQGRSVIYSSKLGMVYQGKPHGALGIDGSSL